ncbi:MAG TPA: CDP-alcohol phosphatidyltransferase family protein [Bacteroidia bacterium]|nr:CDP-alcohol phosphatidyltransferase family protein [Bacteroidia bacterium]
MSKRNYYLVNSITLYRLLAAPVLVLLVFLDQYDIFKWMLAISFCTDAIDGYLARKLKVTSSVGAKLDSIADLLTLIAALIAVYVFKPEFVERHQAIIISMVVLLIVQHVLAIWKYKRVSSFHTYLAKVAMFFQGCFLILLFLLPEPAYWLFYPAAAITLLDLAEEIVLVLILPKWESNVKGIYWVLKRKKGSV